MKCPFVLSWPYPPYLLPYKGFPVPLPSKDIIATDLAALSGGGLLGCQILEAGRGCPLTYQLVIPSRETQEAFMAWLLLRKSWRDARWVSPGSGVRGASLKVWTS